MTFFKYKDKYGEVLGVFNSKNGDKDLINALKKVGGWEQIDEEEFKKLRYIEFKPVTTH